MEDKIKRILEILIELPDEELELLSRAMHEIVKKKCLKGIENTDSCGIMNMDDEENGWWTTENGKHYHVGENGEVDKGPNFLKGKPIDHTKASKSSKKESPDVKSSETSKANRGGDFPKQAGKDIHGSVNATKEAPEPNETVGGYLGGGNGGGKGPGKSYKPGERSKGGHIVIDTADAVGEKNKDGSLKDNSLRKYVDADGNLSEERQKHHDQIIDAFLKGKKPVENKTMTMLGGGPASGKSGLHPIEKDSDTEVKIDPDEVKKALDGYKEMALESTEAAAYYHEESSALAKSEYAESLELGCNVCYDGTGDGSPNSVRSKINKAKKAGYKVAGQYATVDTEEAIARNRSRYEHALKKFEEDKANGKKTEPPRLVPDDYVRSCHSKVTDCLVECAEDFDEIELYDNNVARGEPMVKIATGGNGKPLRAVKGQEKKLENFLNKGEGKYSVDSDGYVKIEKHRENFDGGMINDCQRMESNV